MHEIEYKDIGCDKFEKYVFIGSFDVDPNDNIDNYFGFPTIRNIENWKKYFSKSDDVTALNAWNYFYIRATDYGSFFEDMYGKDMSELIRKNIHVLEEVLDKWFYLGSTAFHNGLDFKFIDEEKKIIDETYSVVGNLQEIIFEDESIIRFLSEDDDYKGCFILKSDVEVLEKDLKVLFNLLVNEK